MEKFWVYFCSDYKAHHLDCEPRNSMHLWYILFWKVKADKKCSLFQRYIFFGILSLFLCNLSVARNLVRFTSLWLMGRLAIKFNTLLTIQSFQRRTRRILSKLDVVMVCYSGLKFSSSRCVSILFIVISDKGRNSYMLINLSLSATKFFSLLKIYLWIDLYLHSSSF